MKEPTDPSRTLDSIDTADGELILACLRAAVEGPFFPDWEFSTLLGLSREQLRAVIARWSDADPDEETRIAVNNTLVNLLGYPHGEDARLTGMIGAERADLERVLGAWRAMSKRFLGEAFRGDA